MKRSRNLSIFLKKIPIFDESYQKRDIKEGATASIAQDLNRDVADVKAKWNSIRGEFGRELSKTKSSKSGQSTEELYVSQWALWDRFQFLQNVMGKTKSKDMLVVDNSLTLSSEEDELGASDTSVSTATKETKSEKMKMKRRKLQDTKAELLTSCFNVLKAPAPAPVPEVNHFAFHIAAKLDGMSKMQRILAEKGSTTCYSS